MFEINEPLILTGLALNMKEPKIHKTVYIDGVEEKIVDQEATIVAQQKQELIKQAFTKWIFADEERKNSKRYTKQEDEHYRGYHGKYLHRAVWEFYNGKIPIGYVIHHKDGNPENNDIENLQLMSKTSQNLCRVRKKIFSLQTRQNKILFKRMFGKIKFSRSF